MKKIVINSILVSFLMLNIAATCNSDEDDPQPDNFQSLLGKWKFVHFDGSFTQTNGSVDEVSWNAEDRGIEIYWEFKSNGEFIGTYDGQSGKGRWELEVTKLDGTIIDEGKLSIVGFDNADLTDIIGTKDLVYDVHTTRVTVNSNTYISLVGKVDASKARDGLKTIFRYHYRKL